MTPEQLSEMIKEAVREEVRLGVREALQAEQKKKDDADRERQLNKSVEEAVARMMPDSHGVEESII